MLFDTHCHLDFHQFDDDREAIMTEAAAAEVAYMLNPAIDVETGAAALRLADQWPGVYATVGFHPNRTAALPDQWLEVVQTQAAHAKAVAIGEIGLDYHWDLSPKKNQQAAFEAQLNMAAQLNKPVVIHNREAHEDTLAILRTWAATLEGDLASRPGVLHSFSGDVAMAEKVLELGFYLGFTGPITYKKADEMRRVASMAPLDRLLIETDAPYLTPHPHRGKRNVPAYVRLVAEQMATLRGLSLGAFGQQSTANAFCLFGISDKPAF
jgi:TatD DNase family protein